MTTQLISKARVLEIAETSWGKFSAEQYSACHLKFAERLEAELLERLGQGFDVWWESVHLKMYLPSLEEAYQAGAANALLNAAKETT